MAASTDHPCPGCNGPTRESTRDPQERICDSCAYEAMQTLRNLYDGALLDVTRLGIALNAHAEYMEVTARFLSFAGKAINGGIETPFAIKMLNDFMAEYDVLNKRHGVLG